MAGDIHFFSGYPVFGLEGEGDRDNHFRLKTVVEHIPQNMVDEGNHFRLSYSEAFSLPLTCRAALGKEPRRARKRRTNEVREGRHCWELRCGRWHWGSVVDSLVGIHAEEELLKK
jgi:hypothetical protein